MKFTTYITSILLVLVLSCKKNTEKVKIDKTNPSKETNTEQGNAPDSKDMPDLTDKNASLAGMLESLGMDSINIENESGVESLFGNRKTTDVLYQMLGKQTIDKQNIPKASLDSLKKIIEKHPTLSTSDAITISNSSVQVDFPRLAKSLSKLEKKELKQIIAILPSKKDNSSNTVSKNPFENTFIDENLNGNGFAFYATTKSSQLYNKLEHATPEEAQEILAEHYGIGPEEVVLLKSIEKQPDIRNERQARELSKAIYNDDVEAALKNPNVSDNFKNLIKKQKAGQKRNAKRFIARSSRAREAFYKLNPGWHGKSDETIGNTYLDSRNKTIYLPLGKLSFADEMVDFNPGSKGQHPKGALHEPNALTSFYSKPNTIFCNIGLKGVLTLQFTDNAITDVNGPDLYVFEIGAIEPTILEISSNGHQWIEVGKIKGGTAMVDIADYVEKGKTFTYIRLTDLNTSSGVPGADVDAVAAIGGAVRLQLDSSVLFEFGKHKLKPEAKTILSDLIPQLENMGKGTIVVEGHTDNVGDNASNKKLSQQRAKSVQELLTALMGNSSGNFNWKSIGHGESQPLAPNDTEENRQKNRRVELLVLPN